MASKKQIAANRRNAKKSTGPKTAEGKAVSARNATKHGLLSRLPVLPEEDGEAFERLRENLFCELIPVTQLEKLMVARLAALQWRLARVPQLEAELLERLRTDVLGNDEGLGTAWQRDTGAYGGALARLARYETALERNAARLLAELRHLRAERRRDELHGEALAHERQRGPWVDRALEAWPGAPPHPRPTSGGMERGLSADRTPPSPLGGEGGRGDEEMLRNEANGAEPSSEAPANSSLRAHLDGQAFRALGPRLTSLRQAARNGAAPEGAAGAAGDAPEGSD
jgi:hypothetical protein